MSQNVLFPSSIFSSVFSKINNYGMHYFRVHLKVLNIIMSITHVAIANIEYIRHLEKPDYTRNYVTVTPPWF